MRVNLMTGPCELVNHRRTHEHSKTCILLDRLGHSAAYRGVKRLCLNVADSGRSVGISRQTSLASAGGFLQRFADRFGQSKRADGSSREREKSGRRSATGFVSPCLEHSGCPKPAMKANPGRNLSEDVDRASRSVRQGASCHYSASYSPSQRRWELGCDAVFLRSGDDCFVVSMTENVHAANTSAG